jgi:hypothetical protein
LWIPNPYEVEQIFFGDISFLTNDGGHNEDNKSEKERDTDSHERIPFGG